MTAPVVNPLDPIGTAETAVRLVSGLLPGANAAGGLVDGVVAVRRWISDRHNWVRVGWFVAGGLLFYGGIAVLARKQIIGAAQATGVTPGQLVSSGKAVVTRGVLK